MPQSETDSSTSSPDAHLREDTLTSEAVYQGHFLELRRDQVVLPDGREATREYVVHPGAVMIVAILPDGRLVMERQYRYPVRQTMIEFPAGKLDAGEGGWPVHNASCWKRRVTARVDGPRPGSCIR